MKILQQFIALTLAFALSVLGFGFVAANQAAAQTTRPYRISDRQVENLLARLETRSDSFRTNLDRALDASRYNERSAEENINEFVKDFENATDELRRKFGDRASVGADASNLIVYAARIDDFMRNNLRGYRVVQRDWNLLRRDLNTLANYYNLSFNLDNRRNLPSLPMSGGMLTTADARFTGTYRLDTVRSDSARDVASRATFNLNRRRRDRIFDNLVNRLTAPDQLAVERQGNRVTIASTLAPQVVLDVDNRLRTERYPNGRVSNVRATFSGDQLTVVANGDRANDFTAIFMPTDNGRRMMVTRRVYAEGLTRFVETRSYYDRTSETAQFNIFNGNMNAAMTNTNVNNNFLVPNNTTVSAVLNTDLSTRTARDGDRFTMTVRSPSQYNGAIIEGFVSNANRSGRVSGRSEITLNYETIRVNNQTYRFAGITDSVLTTNGNRVQVDREGAVEEDSSRTRTTVERTAIGGAIGAIIGAIAGGGSGAAIGAGIGAGAGAGSVYVQGRDDLTLQSGSEVTVISSAPRS